MRTKPLFGSGWRDCDPGSGLWTAIPMSRQAANKKAHPGPG